MNNRLLVRCLMALLVVTLFAGAFGFLARDARAQDNQPEVTATVSVPATVNGNQIEATVEPIGLPIQQQNDPTPAIVSVLVDKLIEIVLTIALIALAFKVAGLVPQETVDKTLARAFDLAMGLADTTSTPIDNKILDIARPIVTRMIDDELAKRNSVTLNVTNPDAAAFAANALIRSNDRTP